MEKKLMSRKEVENCEAKLSSIQKILQPFTEKFNSPDDCWLKAKIGETFFYIKENIGEKSFRFYVFVSTEDKTFNHLTEYRKTDNDDYWNHDLTILEFHNKFKHWLKENSQLGDA